MNLFSGYREYSDEIKESLQIRARRDWMSRSLGSLRNTFAYRGIMEIPIGCKWKSWGSITRAMTRIASIPRNVELASVIIRRIRLANTLINFTPHRAKPWAVSTGKTEEFPLKWAPRAVASRQRKIYRIRRAISLSLSETASSKMRFHDE